jgi:Cadherin domain
LPPTISSVTKADPSVSSCPAGNNGTITVTATGANLRYSRDFGVTWQVSNVFTGLTPDSYNISVKNDVTGCQSSYGTQLVLISPCNKTPVVTSAATATTPENIAVSTIVYTATATDPDAGQTKTYSFDSGGADNAIFTIDPTTGAVRFIASPDFEMPKDVNGDNIYEITIKVCDNGNPVACALKDVQITVTDVFECSVATPTTSVIQPTCAVATGKIIVIAPSSGVTYSFDNGATYQASATSNSLAAGTYQVMVKENVTNCLSAVKATVVNVQPATPAISNVAKTNPSVSSCPALNDGTMTVTATGANLLYSKDNGATWQASNTFTGLVAGSYTIAIKDSVSRCQLVYASNPVVLTVPSCNLAPTITSATTATTPENVATTTAVYTVTATDPNAGQTLTFSFEAGGADNGKFTIDPTTGEVKFIASPDFELPTDANGDNIYEIKVKVCDNGTPQYCDVKTVQITVTDVIECTGFAAPTTTVAQPTCTVATGTITVTAPANNVTYSFDNGTTFQATATSNALAAGTYQVKVKDNTTNCVSTATATIINAQPASPTISSIAKTDASLSSCPALNDGTISVTANGSNLQYSIDNGATWQVSNSFAGLVAGSYTVKVKDNTSTCEVAYTSNPVVLTAPICNLPPTITSAGTATTPENVSPTTPVYTVTSTDPNVGQTPTYSFETGGVDNAKFNIDPSTGVVTFITSPDFETPMDADNNNIYEIKVKVCDNGTPPYCATKTVSITVTDVAECPIASVGGTTNYTGGTLCNTANSGIITLTGKTGNVVKWQTSVNAGTSWTDIANTNTTLTFTNAANNQQYRAVVNNSGACVDANSTAKTITTSAAACSTACDAPIPVITGH